MQRSWQLKTRCIRFAEVPAVMGIINVTPDSFSDGGNTHHVTAAVDAALAMEDAGANIIDIGGESTRPYSQSVDADEEMRRVLPVVEQLGQRLACPISIDTSKAIVARRAIEAGAEIVNDVTGLEGDREMIATVQNSGVGVCVMHMQGTPQTMQDSPQYVDVVDEIIDYLRQRKTHLIAAGISEDRICLDPGIGFGKTHAHNWTLVRNAARFLELDSPILIGHSRKGFIGKCVGPSLTDRDTGTSAISLSLAAAGMHVLRVHNVPMTIAALKIFKAMQL